MKKNELTVIEHFVELRRRLVFIVVFFLLAMIGSFFLAEPLIVYLQQTDEAASLELNAFRLTDPLKIYMQIAFIIACVITSPFVLYQLWACISPGLYEKEKKLTLAYIPVSVFLFLSCISFSYF
ncbi:MAG: twin-arginine translocase subunit TatC, partial [Bacillus sp. (in: Bacteria)]|nr:twin-arginine translocase subunit TatC [Bacillus sp. (in: firmicutes)]